MFDKEEDDDNQPATQIMRSESGRAFDANNISGSTKKRLIEEGEMDAGDFGTPDNMPGSKLKEFREAQAEKFNKGNPKAKTNTNPYKLGDVVRFKNHVSEIIEVNKDNPNQVKINKTDGKPSKWINHEKLVPVTHDSDE